MYLWKYFIFFFQNMGLFPLILKEIGSIKKFSRQPVTKCWEPNFFSPEVKWSFYHQKLNIGVASWIAKQLKTEDIEKWVNFKKISKLSARITEYPVFHPKLKIWLKDYKIEQNQRLNFSWKSYFTRFHKLDSGHFVTGCLRKQILFLQLV